MYAVLRKPTISTGPGGNGQTAQQHKGTAQVIDQTLAHRSLLFVPTSLTEQCLCS